MIRFYKIIFQGIIIICFFISQIQAQTIQTVSNPVAGNYWSYPIEYNGKLYFEFQASSYIVQLACYNGSAITEISNPGGGGLQTPDDAIIYDNKLYFNYVTSAGIHQLAQYDGNTMTLIPNPDSSPYGYAGNPIVYNGKLYIGYLNSLNVYQLAQYDGITLKLITNPDNTSGNGSGFATGYYVGKPIIYNNKLYLLYINTLSVGHLVEYDGINLTIIPNPDSSPGGYNGSPIIYNNKLYIQYNSFGGVYHLAQYDGSTFNIISNPDAAGIVQGYFGDPIIYNNSLYILYRNVSNVFQLAEYNGTSAINLIPNNPNSNSLLEEPFILYNNKLYFQCINSSNQGQLGQYDGSISSIISNPSMAQYWGDEIVYNNNLYFDYLNLSTGHWQLGQYNGTSLNLINNPDAGGGAIGPFIEYNDTLFFGYANILSVNNLAYLHTPLPPPTIYSFTPTVVCYGTTVDITGINFTQATSVNFGDSAAKSFTINSDTSITAIPASGSSGLIKVTTSAGTATSTDTITTMNCLFPSINSFTPNTTCVNTSVNITGTNFLGTTSISFGGIAAESFTINSDTSITAMPDSGSSGLIKVTTPNGIGISADSIIIQSLPTINAGSDTTIITGSSVNLIGTTNDIGGVYLWTTTSGSISNPYSLITQGNPNNTDTLVTYTLKVTNTSGCEVSAKKIVTINSSIDSEYTLKPPNAFTPNGDGYNDVWIVFQQGGYVQQVKVDVYNRWGSLVYHSDNYNNDWDGKYNGSPLPDATYYYVVSPIYSDGRHPVLKGSLTILR